MEPKASVRETRLQMEERHVAESCARLAGQRELVKRLERGANVVILGSARDFLEQVEAFHLQALAGLERARRAVS